MTLDAETLTGFEFECEHLQAAWIVTRKRVASLMATRGLSVTEDGLAALALDLSQDIDGTLPAELRQTLDRVRLHNSGRGRESEPVEPETIRGMAYAIPALAAAMAAGRNPLDPELLEDVLDVMWRTALWRLGRGFHGELASVYARLQR